MSRPWRFVKAAQSLVTGQENTQLDQLLRSKVRAARVSKRLRD